MQRISEDGFTLIELMITSVVVVLFLTGFLVGNMVIQRSGEVAYEKTVAVQDANQVIERMRNTAQTGAFPVNVTAVFPNNGLVAGFNNLANEQVRVSYVNAGVDPLDVTVTVTWLASGGRQTTTALRSIITQRG